MKYIFSTLFFILLVNQAITIAQVKNDAPLSKNAPKDIPTKIIGEEEMRNFDKQIAPYVKKAKKTLSYAKNKFLTGLKKGEAFFLTIRLFDINGQWEQVFVRVTDWQHDFITGYIDSDILKVKKYKSLDNIQFTEDKILDWLITKPDGKEEGNFVGKYLDTLQ